MINTTFPWMYHYIIKKPLSAISTTAASDMKNNVSIQQLAGILLLLYPIGILSRSFFTIPEEYDHYMQLGYTPLQGKQEQ